MSKLTLTKNTNAIFLAFILVAGTITAFSSSFMVETAQAAPYLDMDREKKADKKSVSVSSLKCNNINVNVNGLELDVFPPFLGGGLAAETQEGTTDASSFAGNGADGSEINDFRFICINNNNNTVVVGEEPPLPPVEDECAEDIEACFQEFLLEGQFELLSNALESPTGLTVEINGQEVTLRSFADICSALETSLEGLTIVEVRAAVAAILSGALLPLPEANFTGLAICIAEAIGIPVSS